MEKLRLFRFSFCRYLKISQIYFIKCELWHLVYNLLLARIDLLVWQFKLYLINLRILFGLFDLVITWVSYLSLSTSARLWLDSRYLWKSIIMCISTWITTWPKKKKNNRRFPFNSLVNLYQVKMLNDFQRQSIAMLSKSIQPDQFNR